MQQTDGTKSNSTTDNRPVKILFEVDTNRRMVMAAQATAAQFVTGISLMITGFGDSTGLPEEVMIELIADRVFAYHVGKISAYHEFGGDKMTALEKTELDKTLRATFYDHFSQTPDQSEEAQ